MQVLQTCFRILPQQLQEETRAWQKQLDSRQNGNKARQMAGLLLLLLLLFKKKKKYNSFAFFVYLFFISFNCTQQVSLKTKNHKQILCAAVFILMQSICPHSYLSNNISVTRIFQSSEAFDSGSKCYELGLSL